MRASILPWLVPLLVGACGTPRPTADPGPDPVDVPADPGPGDEGAPDPGPVDVAPGPRVDCKSCLSDADCGGEALCLGMGGAPACLHRCRGDADCPPYYVCYDGRPEGAVCQPFTFRACVACAHDAPCGGETACDLETGECVHPAGFCDPCKWDFHCPEGQRCLWDGVSACTGRCLDPCGDDLPCRDTANFRCLADDRGRRLCQPISPPTCAGCPAPTPFPSDNCRGCYECLNDSHCDIAAGEVCDRSTHACTTGPCTHARCGVAGWRCPDCGCRQCCTDADCENGQGPCVDGRCAGTVDPCQGQCADPFPVCAILNNIAQCVQCGSDVDCRVPPGEAPCFCTQEPTYTCLEAAGSVCPVVLRACRLDADCQQIDPSCACTGDPEYRCLWPDGLPCHGTGCPAFCTADEDCLSGAGAAPRRCAGQSRGVGHCLAPDGRCDGVRACCAAGQQCTQWPPDPRQPGAPTPAYCSCDALRPCEGDVPCTPVADLCGDPEVGATICPAGVPSPLLPERLCLDPASLAGVR